MKISNKKDRVVAQVCASMAVILMSFVAPNKAEASILGIFGGFFGIETEAHEIESSSDFNSQNVPLLESNVTPELKNTGSVPIFIDSGALEANVGPAGTEGDVDGAVSSSDIITVYTVQDGDTLDSIAKANKTTPQAIIYANRDIPKSELTTSGQTLVIFPVKGVVYKVQKGDTVGGLATKYKINTSDILEYNLMESSKDLRYGQEILLPGITSLPKETTKSSSKSSSSSTSKPSTAKTSSGKITTGYIWPFPAGYGRVTQGMHHNSYDFGAPIGTPILAVRSGTILTVKSPAYYNGGYGGYVVMNFDNGAQAIFAHMSKTAATPGQRVNQGDVIGYVGSTGRSTGPHLHLEFRGGWANPYSGLPKGARGL